VAPNAPADRSIPMDSCLLEATERATAPLIAQARSTYPAAKARYLMGLPTQQSFFVVTYLHDSLGAMERVFIAVDSITGQSGTVGRIHGRIWNEINLVRGYTFGQPYAFSEGELLDWLITHADGSEEGNLIGKFVDEWQPPPACHQ